MSIPWNPFPEDGQWADPKHWREFEGFVGDESPLISLLRKMLPPVSLLEQPLERLLKPLAEVFPPAWALEQGKLPDAHPLKRDLSLRARRPHVLRLGHAMSRVGPLPSSMKKRLRGAETYDAAVAELLVGLALRDTGAVLDWEREGQLGPDWIARWSGGIELAVEVYRPQLSCAENDDAVAASEVLFGAMEVLHPLELSQPIYLALAPPDDAVRACRGSARAARELGVRIGRAIEPVVSPVTPLGAFDVGEFGSFTTHAMRGTDKMLQVESVVPLGSDDHNLRRIETELGRKRKQIAASGLPGFVVIDWSAVELGASCNILGDLLERMDAGEGWAADLVGLGIMRHGCSADLRVPSTTLDLMPGVRALQVFAKLPGLTACEIEELAELPGLETCEHSHFHLHSPFRWTGRCPEGARGT